MNPTVSVIIPTHNHSRFVGQAIDSVLAQTHAPFEVIVVDDGSSDDTPAALVPYSAQIRVLRQDNQGVSAARNNGARVATGDVLAFLDADDLWFPEKLQHQVERFLEEPDLGLVHCGIEEIDGTGACLNRRLDGREGWAATEMLLLSNPVVLGAGSTAMIPRPVFERMGGFDTRLSTSADWDLCYRIATHHRIGFVREILVSYRLHGSNMHRNVRVMEHDMLLGYQKAFSDSNAQVQEIRRRCYGNLHAVLAGSFFSVGAYGGFVKHALKSIMLTPDNLRQFAAFPIRRWRRREALPIDSSSETAV
ncbi:MAG TPA: glycosyltransferase family 2 protein [Blastocatellia bacterium]|nr:glycosyltransferase family 2 protein [Blastocatellia bacterium]